MEQSVYNIESTPHRDGNVHFNPKRPEFPHTASVYGINSKPLKTSTAAKRWITATMKQEKFT